MGLLYHTLWIKLVLAFGLSTFEIKYVVWIRAIDEGSVPDMRIWFILLIKSDLKWCTWIHLSRFLFIFQLLDDCHCWWTRDSPIAHVAEFYDRLRLIRSVLRTSKLYVLKLIEIVILWVYYTLPFDLSLLWHLWDITFQLLYLNS